MHQHVIAIRNLIRADVAAGKAVDVDSYCRLFAALYPGIPAADLKTVILQVVGAYGGGAVWGTEALSRPRGGEPGSDPA